MGASPPLVKPLGIDDVPIVSFTLFSRDANFGRYDLERVAHSLEAELLSIAGTFRTSEKGLPPEVQAKPAQVRLEGDKLVMEALKF